MEDSRREAMASVMGVKSSEISYMEVDYDRVPCGCYEPCSCATDMEFYVYLMDGTSRNKSMGPSDVLRALTTAYEAGVEASKGE